MKVGRPTDYCDELRDKICERIADGQSVREICRDKRMPNQATVFRWLSKYTDFSEQYAKAKEAQMEHLAEEMLEIADDGSNDWIQRNDANNPGYNANGEVIARSKLRIETRKWLMGKLKPKKYGEKLQTELSGPDGGPIEVTNPADIIAQKLDEIAKRKGGQEAD